MMQPDGTKEVPMQLPRTSMAVLLLAVIFLAAPPVSAGKGKDKPERVPQAPSEMHGHPPAFLPEERQIILAFYQGPSSGLPPGLAKRGGQLPPGLQKHLQRQGTLPPGLQKRLQPLPTALDLRLPSLPDIWVRVVLGPHILLIDWRSNQILDMLENILAAP
jgi:hypothetical protein